MRQSKVVDTGLRRHDGGSGPCVNIYGRWYYSASMVFMPPTASEFAGRTATWPRRISFLLPSAAPRATPANSGTAAPTAATADEPDDQKQHDGAYGGVEDRTDNSHAKMDIEPGQQPVADEGADHTDYHVTDEAKAGSPDDLTGQPAGGKTDE
jgi:hypothetical protein